MTVSNPSVKFEHYRRQYQHIRMDRSEGGILEMVFHKDGGPFRMCALAHAELCDAFYQISADHENKIIIMTGTGNVFCTNFDSDFDVSNGEGVAKIHWEGRRLLQNLLDVEAPIISAVNGPSHVHCFPVVADIVLCTDDTTFKDGHVSDIGIAVGDGANIVWPHLIGPTRGKFFLFTGQEIDAQEARTLGVVNEVLPYARLLQRARELAELLARRSAPTLRYSRLVLNQHYRRMMLDDVAMSYGLQNLDAATRRH